MIFESDQYYDGFPHAISSENEEKTSFNDYARRCCSNQGTIPQFGDLIS